MCMQDLAMARYSFSGELTVAIDNATRVGLVGQDRHRTTLIISAPTTGFVSLSTNPNAALADGIRLTAGSVPLILNIGNVSNLVTRPWFALHSAGADTLGVMFTTLVIPDDAINSIMRAFVGD